MVAVILIDNNTELYGKIAELIEKAAVLDLSVTPLRNQEKATPRPPVIGNSRFRRLAARAEAAAPARSSGPYAVHEHEATRFMTSYAGINIHVDECRTEIDGHEVTLNLINFRLLHFFIAHPDKVFSRRQLLNQVWGNESYIQERTVDTHIHRLREQLADYDRAGIIQTVRGFGYRCSAVKT